MERQGWDSLGFKDRAAYITAIASFTLGWVIIFIGMLLEPTGEIDGTVITCFGIALSYCGGVFGIALYVKDSKAEVYHDIMGKVNEKIAEQLEKHEGK